MTMADDFTQKIVSRLYDLSWSCALPWLRLNNRLPEGYEQRTLKKALPAEDLWIQAASIGESYMAAEIIKTLKISKTNGRM